MTRHLGKETLKSIKLARPLEAFFSQILPQLMVLHVLQDVHPSAVRLLEAVEVELAYGPKGVLKHGAQSTREE